MKKILVALITLGLLLAPISAVQAQTNSEVRINLNFADDVVYVNADDYIVLFHGWGACTPGLIRSYLSAVHTELYIDDVLVSTADGKDQYWGPITKVQDAWFTPYCIAGNQNTFSLIYWEYPLGTLTLGEYEVDFYYRLDHRVIDGADSDGDGRLDSWIGPFRDKIFTIIVE